MKAYIVAAFVAGNVLVAAHAGAQDADLTAARDLYASAAYDDALTMLNRLRSSEHPASQSRAIEQYRAFCLLALGRSADAEQAIEAVVAAEPSFQPGETDASPRIRSAFTTVRRRMLPSIIQQKYAQAKVAYDRKEFGAAADGFAYVLAALADQDVAVEARQPPLSDLRTLAGGFQELAAKAAAPPPPPPPAPVVALPPPPPPPPPTAPPLPYSFVGMLEDKSRPQAFLARGEVLNIVKVGDVIDNSYRVEALSASQVVLTYLPLNQTQTLSVSQGQK